MSLRVRNRGISPQTFCNVRLMMMQRMIYRLQCPSKSLMQRKGMVNLVKIIVMFNGDCILL